MLPPRERFNPDLLDPAEPFEIDSVNRPHLYSHAQLSEDDLWDVWLSDWRLFPARNGGEADWLLVARVPGGDCLCAPLAPAKSGDFRKCRPIGLYRASVILATMYDNAIHEG